MSDEERVAENESTEVAEQDANQPESSTEQTEESTQQEKDTGAEPAKSAVEAEPWHKSERFRKLTEKNRKAEERLESLQGKYEELLQNQARMNNLTREPNGQVDPERKNAILQLVQAIKEVPEAGEMLGLGQNRELQQKLEQLEQSRSAEAFNSELDRSLDSYAEKFGMDKGELGEMFQEFLESNPFFGQGGYSKGKVDSAFKAMLFDRQSELGERATNLKLIKDKKAKTTQGTQSNAKSTPAKGKVLPKKMEDHLDNLIRENGGEIDFG